MSTYEAAMRRFPVPGMDLLVGVSNCPQERNPCNGWNPTPMGMIVYQP